MSYKQPSFLGPHSSDFRLGHSNLSRPHLTPARNYKEDSVGSFNELEQLLDRERQKYRDMKDKLEKDLDQERSNRLGFENKLIKLKNEMNERDNYLSEKEFRENNILHQMEDTNLENEKLKAELARMEDVYGTRLSETELELETKTRQFEEFSEQCNVEFDKYKKEGQEFVESLTFEHERKKKMMEDKLRQAENSKKDLHTENKKLTDTLLQNKLAHEEEVRELGSRLREEETRKSQLQSKSFEQRLKSFEDARESLSRKNLQLMRLLQDKDRQLQEFEQEKHNEVERARLEVSDLLNKNSQLSMLYEKIKNELLQKDALISRSTGESSQEAVYLKQQLQQKRKESQVMSTTIRDLRQNLKDSSGDFERKRAELSERCSYFEGEAKKNKDMYVKICETLKARINETITNVSYK